MKRTLACMLALVMLLSVCAGFAQAEGSGWVCLGCAGENGSDAQACGQCGMDRASMWDTVCAKGYIQFGHYEQDADPNTKDEPIVWKVLAVDTNAGTMLVLSEKILESRPYQSGDSKTKYVVWADSEMRQWLNSSFMDTAFSQNEQQMIALSEITTEPVNGFTGGPDCQDQIFLLSRREVMNYFPGETPLDYILNGQPRVAYYNMDRCALATKYAKEQGCYRFDQGLSYQGMERFEGFSYWWLRNPGESDNMAALVYFDGRLGNYFGVADGARGVRPAMRISMNAGETENG